MKVESLKKENFYAALSTQSKWEKTAKSPDQYSDNQVGTAFLMRGPQKALSTQNYKGNKRQSRVGQ